MRAPRPFVARAVFCCSLPWALWRIPLQIVMLSSFSVPWLKVMVVLMVMVMGMGMATEPVVLMAIGVVEVQLHDVEQMLRAQVL